MDLTKLNDQQKKAVEITEGPLLILAGAGSGKTRVLTTKVAYLIEDKMVDPGSILAITFTNKAAKEMKDRIISMIGLTAYKIQISTFHSFGLFLLRENYELLGFQKNFTILDSDDTLVLIKNILKEINIEENPRSIKNAISNNKNELLLPEDYERFVQTAFDETVLEVYKRYQSRLKLNNSVDFDDLLLLPIILFRKHPEILEKYQERFKYILIDEYQDTNEAQYLLAKMISVKYKNICVVGDDSQSIYSWRGSNYKNILNFEKDYPGCQSILLEQNYRSTKTIIEASNNLIKNNITRKDKNLWTDNEEGPKIEYNQALNEKDEAYYVCKEILKLIDAGVNPGNIAILYRTNAQARNFEDELLLENIPYKVVGSFYFYNRKEIKDLIAYLKLIYNPHDDISLIRVINVPKRKIGKVTIDNIQTIARENNTSLFEAITSGKELEFKRIIQDLIKIRDEVSLTELVETILTSTGLKNEIENEKPLEAELRLENLEEFKSIAFQFEERYGIISLGEFLSEISLFTDVEEYRNNSSAVTLMTIHLAKGLEFDNVFVVGLEEGVFPHFNSLSSTADLEEERRLCYVAITRARRKLYLVGANTRTLYGLKKSNPISRFINEIDAVHFKEGSIETKEQFIDENAEYNLGDRIEFDPYGIGIITGIKDRILTVAFNHPHGIKMLIKGHKKIRKV